MHTLHLGYRSIATLLTAKRRLCPAAHIYGYIHIYIYTLQGAEDTCSQEGRGFTLTPPPWVHLCIHTCVGQNYIQHNNLSCIFYHIPHCHSSVSVLLLLCLWGTSAYVLPDVWRNFCVRMHVCVLACVHVCACVCACVCLRVCMCVHVQMSTSAYALLNTLQECG